MASKQDDDHVQVVIYNGKKDKKISWRDKQKTQINIKDKHVQVRKHTKRETITCRFLNTQKERQTRAGS